jgi:hypothetical protein
MEEVDQASRPDTKEGEEMLALGTPKEFVYLIRGETSGSDSVDFEEYVPRLKPAESSGAVGADRGEHGQSLTPARSFSYSVAKARIVEGLYGISEGLSSEETEGDKEGKEEREA